MLHSYIKVFIHFIWSTKEREKYLDKSARPQVERHLAENAWKNKILIDTLNVQIDHVHMLISLSSDQKIDDIARLLKGESSHWINEESIISGKFSWQRGYAAFSVNPMELDAVRWYIKNQDEHHRQKTFAEEYRSILEEHGFSIPETDESV
jgi:REP element-mobilizing transposase RayT